MLRLILLAAVASASSASPFFSQPSDLATRAVSLTSSCSTTGSASCHNTSSVSNLCCFESPGGLLLQTQFWDTNPSTGPSDKWTIHGLWPDNCDGTFEQNCDPSRAYTNIASLLSSGGASDTLSFMQTNWVDINGQNEQFWAHEWSTHGTCMSTLHTSCIPSGSVRGTEAVAFFQTVVKLYKTLPTFDWLAGQGIRPSTTQTFTLATLTSALKTASGGFTPALDCSSGALNQISWYFNLRGSIIDGTFVPINAPKAGSCPSSGIRYPPKTGSGTPLFRLLRTMTIKIPDVVAFGLYLVANALPRLRIDRDFSLQNPGGLPTRATIHAIRSGSQTGGLLSLGTWSSQTLATFTLTGTASSFTMTSSKGNCGVSGGSFSCGSGVSPTTFSAVTSGSDLLLASGGSTAWGSDGIPSGSTVFTVFTGSSHSQDYTLTIVGA
ncbi:ribonuclease T2 [Pleurotus eryngii]|uniref:Ribonuclease T2-like n=1 Tax=Pleurotus eryngii TaxID=5323 RepID=A0A9P6ABL3_PLEER|nr:ribonuclease T2 [Pleurotus eryngii]